MMVFLLLFLLVASCVLIHGAGMVAGLVLLNASLRRLDQRFSPMGAGWLLTRIVFGLLLLHLTQILVWAAVYQWEGCFADFGTAFYYSTTSYSTVGYGDVIPSAKWRTMGAVEAVIGILMFGWSTGALFTCVNRVQSAFMKDYRNRQRHPD
ncbi:MAG: two pore domain potassium channel family protein [Verrucomicrobia bacterium]|nr:two pore domain potassium channel family protein [Verrucomicrobiota bacterium]